MWQKLLVWALKFALQRLSADVDAETQKQLDDYNRQRDELEAKEDTALYVIGQIESRLTGLEIVRQQKENDLQRLESELPELNQKLEKIRDEKNKKLAAVQSLNDDSLLHGTL